MSRRAPRPGGAHAGSGRPPRHVVLPEHAWMPLAGTVLLLAMWAGVAHVSGSGWVQAVGAVVAGVLLLGLAAPAFAAPGLRVVCRSSPTDAVAGAPVEIEVIANRSMRCSPRSTGGTAALLARRVPTPVVLIPPRRGVVRNVTVRLATAAPFGLLWWSRDQVLELARPLWVAPRESPGAELPLTGGGRQEGIAPPRAAVVGDLRGVRPYEYGDSRRRVHWHASAHTGDLMVRESEISLDEPTRVLVDLPQDPEQADRRAEEAMGELVRLLSGGRRVLLETTEPVGRVVAPVTDRLGAGRRLARAVAEGAWRSS